MEIDIYYKIIELTDTEHLKKELSIDLRGHLIHHVIEKKQIQLFPLSLKSLRIPVVRRLLCHWVGGGFGFDRPR